MHEENPSDMLVEGATASTKAAASKDWQPSARNGTSDRNLSGPAAKKGFRGLPKIIGFFALVIVVAFVLNALFNHGLRKIKTSKFGAMNTVMTGAANADIVINGSSRALSHYDPRSIERITGHSAFNIGMNASQIDLQLAMLKTYLEHNRKPAMVIQNLDLFSFETTKKGEIYDPGYMTPYLYDKELYEPLHKIDPVVWKWRYIPLYGYAIEDMRFTWMWAVLGCFGINGHEDYIQGFNPRNAAWNQDFQSFRSQNTSGVKFKIEAEGVAAMEELIQYCTTRNIKVVLVYSPEYIEMQDMEANRPEIIAKFQELSSRYQVPFWDYSGSDISRRQDWFQNSQHLNAVGAEAFSDDLSRKLASGFFAVAGRGIAH